MQIVFSIFLFVLGACFGSFLCCQARRMNRCLQDNVSEKCLSGFNNSRSVCLHCNYQLKWYDNIPIFSWLFLRGKCRKCHKKIGYAEIISELALAITWLSLGLTFHFASAQTLDWIIFIVTLLLTLPLYFLAIYDGLYGELPTTILILAVVFAAVLLIIKQLAVFNLAGFSADLIFSPLFAVFILAGTYLLLYLISHGRWVGDGDYLLCLALALALGDPWLALVLLFLANFLACFFTLPFIKKLDSHKIHFGPFLVAAFFIVTIFSTQLSFISML